jgi:hypothetical protein
MRWVCASLDPTYDVVGEDDMTTSSQDPRKPAPPPSYEPPPRRRGGYQREGIGEAMAKSSIRSLAASLGRVIVRVITGRGR